MRRLWVIPILVIAAVGYALLDSRLGVRTWLALQRELTATQAWNQELRDEIEGLRAEARGLADDPAAIERAIREDFGFGRPGETIVVLPGSAGNAQLP